MHTAVRRSLWFFGLIVALGAQACGSKQSSGADGVLVATQRLQGQWRVQTFVPESQLEAPLQSLLNAELGQLTVTFTGSDYRAVGPGIDITGRYQLQSAANDLVSASFIDSTGVAYRVSGRFDGALFRFHSYDSPWRGDGTLERITN